MAIKSEIRTIYKSKRQALTNSQRLELEERIHTLLFHHFDFKQQFVHTFLPIEKQLEVNTTLINQTLFSLTSKLATSITLFKPLTLTHTIITKKTKYKLDKFNIPTPTIKLDFDLNQLDLVIIPLLAFDNHGNRIGYGKGLYDSFLSNCNPNCVKIGLSYFESLPSIIPTENHDIQLDYCITPSKVYKFNID